MTPVASDSMSYTAFSPCGYHIDILYSIALLCAIQSVYAASLPAAHPWRPSTRRRLTRPTVVAAGRDLDPGVPTPAAGSGAAPLCALPPRSSPVLCDPDRARPRPAGRLTGDGGCQPGPRPGPPASGGRLDVTGSPAYGRAPAPDPKRRRTRRGGRKRVRPRRAGGEECHGIDTVITQRTQ